ncbi:hypothetical protein HPB49_020657 [Dermacentor silvarum]|uniref:Uncharacterized protein n=1 Tax=Dermacentor silvarum TaxID=543639 RepID=A0ACB8C584_DERSI|nr:uncharacterized protein LOC119464604 [Dermacentor silvarum]KAH7934027.1 hypothetical protein HPB49_020657 [Dermacentor silvarum]
MLSSADAILAFVGAILCALAANVSSYPSSPVYGRLQRNAASYAEGQYSHSDPNYYALLRGDMNLGAPASSPDWGQFLPSPWTAGVDAYGGAGSSVVLPAVAPQYDDYADEYDSSATGIQFPPGASPNFGYDWYEAQAQAEQQQQQQQAQLEQQELQEAAVFKDLLANYLSKKSEAGVFVVRDSEKRSETAKKYTAASAGARATSTTARPNVAVLTAPRDKGAAAPEHAPSLSVTSSPVPQPTASSPAPAHPAPVSQEGGQKEYAMFRPVGTAESRRPTFWRGGAKAGAAAAHGKVTRSRFGRFADDSLTEELDQLKSQ